MNTEPCHGNVGPATNVLFDEMLAVAATSSLDGSELNAVLASPTGLTATPSEQGVVTRCV